MRRRTATRVIKARRHARLTGPSDRHGINEFTLPEWLMREKYMITKLPAPWRIVELPSGFAVEDATGKQIGVFYGRAPCSAGHTGIMTIDEARQMAIDFAKLPELLKQNADAE
jgi:hypothetical protein